MTSLEKVEPDSLQRRPRSFALDKHLPGDLEDFDLRLDAVLFEDLQHVLEGLHRSVRVREDDVLLERQHRPQHAAVDAVDRVTHPRVLVQVLEVDLLVTEQRGADVVEAD
jgi:hypothetical protein